MTENNNEEAEVNTSNSAEDLADTTAADDVVSKENIVDTAEESTEEAVVADPAMQFKWYIAQAMSGQENKVCKALKERIVNYKLTDYFLEIVVPEETVISNAGGKKRRLKKKIYPGYVLIQMVMNESTWHLVKDTDKVSGFVGGTIDRPSPLSDEEAAFMTQQMQDGFKKTKTSIDFNEGDSVKVTEGPFANFVGTIEYVSDKGKVKVNVSIFGRPTPVELDFSQVEKI